MNQSEYWISELASLANVSTRTIRYYIQEGLLPQPGIRGKYSVFTEDYMHRLQLIKVLKDAYLPLTRIREVLEALSDEQIVPLLEAFDKDPFSALSSLQALPVFAQSDKMLGSPPRKSALDYISKVRGRQGSIREDKPVIMRSQPQLNIPKPAPVEWQRIELVDGLELHVRQPAPRAIRRLVRHLIEMVNNHLTSI